LTVQASVEEAAAAKKQAVTALTEAAAAAAQVSLFPILWLPSTTTPVNHPFATHFIHR
jgi:hypothetical protein